MGWAQTWKSFIICQEHKVNGPNGFESNDSDYDEGGGDGAEERTDEDDNEHLDNIAEDRGGKDAKLNNQAKPLTKAESGVDYFIYDSCSFQFDKEAFLMLWLVSASPSGSLYISLGIVVTSSYCRHFHQTNSPSSINLDYTSEASLTS